MHSNLVDHLFLHGDIKPITSVRGNMQLDVAEKE